MSRRRTAVLGSLALLLASLVALSPLLPDSSTPDPALRPSGTGSDTFANATAGAGRVTPAMRAEIDRVVRSGLAASRVHRKLTPMDLVRGQVRCASFEGQRYCLHAGWTTDTAAGVRARLVASARVLSVRGRGMESTGDLDPLTAVERLARMSPHARAAAERTELTEAARSVAKVWLLRHQIQGVPLPDGFSDRHPQVASSRAGVNPGSPNGVKTQKDYPEAGRILRGTRTAEQIRTYWCGPATIQMMAWGWTGEDRGQAFWADRLGTTTSGSAITDMVHVVNRWTGWDRETRAGRFVVLDIDDLTFNQWILLTMRQVVDYRAPLVFHPVLLQKFFPYLDDDASGHFQVGRGYSKNGDRPTLISFFEPWNQQRFDPSEPYIDRVQWRTAYKSYRANKAHPMHNLGL